WRPLKYTEVSLNKSINLLQAIRHFGLNREVFENLNLAFRPPAYLRGRTIPKEYTLRLPLNDRVDYTALVASLEESSGAQLAAAEATDANSKDAEWIQVQPGDTLWSISQQLRISTEALKDFNELDNNRLIVGQILKVPSGTKVERERPTAPAPTVAAAVAVQD